MPKSIPQTSAEGNGKAHRNGKPAEGLTSRIKSPKRVILEPDAVETIPGCEEPKSTFPQKRGEGIPPTPESTFPPNQGGDSSPELAALKVLYKKHYYYSDDTVIDLVLGVVAGNDIDSDPIWLHLISPPSGGKTELLFSLQKCKETYFLSNFTNAALISGYKDPPQKGPKQGKGKGQTPIKPTPEKDYSLLPKLNGKVVITKDFTVIHQKPREARDQLLSDLRDVYDGFSSKAFGTSEPKQYHSRFNYLTGMTPAIDDTWDLSVLGERFLLYRIQIANKREHARRALLNARDGDKGDLSVRDELQNAVKVFMDHVKSVKRNKTCVSDDMAEKILDLATLLTTFRTHVTRDREHNMARLPEAELSSRVGKQLMRVGECVAIVRGKLRVTVDEFQMMKRVALDSMPVNRRRMLSALWEARKKSEPLDTFAVMVSHLSTSVVRRELDNLAALGAVERKTVEERGKRNITRKILYRLNAEFIGYCENVGGIPSP